MPSSQANAILRDLQRHKELFDLTKGLGTILMNEAAEGMFDQMNREVDPDGVPWPALSEAYAKWKAKTHPGELISELEHRMKTLEQLDGEREIEADHATQTYGVDEGARQEMSWFVEGDPSRNRPPRKAYELDAATVKRLDAAVEKWGSKRVG